MSATLGRSVEPNRLMMNANGKGHLYRVQDFLEITVNADSPLLRKVLTKIPILKAHGRLRFFRRQYEFTHYTDSIRDGYLSKFELLRAIRDPKAFAAFRLQPLEFIKTFNSLGFEMEAGVGVASYAPFFANEISAMGGVRKILADYFIRDQFGQLHLYLDKTKRAYGGVNLKLGEVDALLGKVSLLGLQYGRSTFRHQATDYVLPLPTNREKTQEILNFARRREEYEALKAIKNFREDPDLDESSAFQKNYQVTSKGKASSSGLSAFFAFGRSRKKSEAETSVILPSGEERHFYRYSVTGRETMGVEKLRVDYGDTHLFLSSRKKVTVDLEMDQKRPDDVLVTIRNEDFFRVREKAELEALISDLNQRYSKDEDTPFFRDYTLPDVGEDNQYRKIYAMTRVFVDGRALKKAVKKMTSDDLRKKAWKHFAFHKELKSGVRAGLKKLSIQRKVRRLSERFEKLKTRLEKYSQVPPKKIAELTESFLVAWHTETYGVRSLREFMGKKGLYVMGDISGILRSSSALQDLQQNQKRRFAGKSWGNYRVVPPIQKFLRYKRLIPPSIYITKSVTDKEMFGDLKTGVASNIEHIFDPDWF